ncbi:MAG: double-strand break repair protein AddB, partial [Rhodospirillales bacterium]|nr:double-strand break repair protein AddB [Rhodospirillales bacterium]
KTGKPPSARDQKTGFAPQLPLLAAMAQGGQFEGLEGAPVSELAYWQLSGGTPAGKKTPFAGNLDDAPMDALDGLKRLIDLFDDADWPYLARPIPGHEPRFDDYEHLARVLEWSTGGGDSE